MPGQPPGTRGLLTYVPNDLFRKFKIKLAREGKTSKGVIMTFISLYCEETDNGNKRDSRENETKAG